MCEFSSSRRIPLVSRGPALVILHTCSRCRCISACRLNFFLFVFFFWDRQREVALTASRSLMPAWPNLARDSSWPTHWNLYKLKCDQTFSFINLLKEKKKKETQRNTNSIPFLRRCIIRHLNASCSIRTQSSCRDQRRRRRIKVLGKIGKWQRYLFPLDHSLV